MDSRSTDRDIVTLKSKQEKYRDGLILLFALGVTAGGYQMSLYNEQVVLLAASTVLFLIALTFKSRWIFSKSNQQLDCYKGFKIGRFSLLKLSAHCISYRETNSLAWQGAGDKKPQPTLSINYLEHSEEMSQSIDVRVKQSVLRLYQAKLAKLLFFHGVNIGAQAVERENESQAHEHEYEEGVKLDKDTEYLFSKVLRMGGSLQRDFTTRTWFMPLTDKRERTALVPAYIACAVSAIAFLITFELTLPIAALVIGTITSGFFWVKQTNQQYACPSSNDNHLVISDTAIEVPGIYFDDLKARTLNKDDIARINVTWAWQVSTSRNGSTTTTTRTVYIFDIAIHVPGQKTAVIPGISLFGKTLIKTMYKLGYDVWINEVDQRPLARTQVMGFIIIVYVVIQVIHGAYMTYSNGAFPVSF